MAENQNIDITDRYKIDLSVYERLRRFVLNAASYSEDPITIFKGGYNPSEFEPFIKGYTILVFTTPMFSVLKDTELKPKDGAVMGAAKYVASSIYHFFAGEERSAFLSNDATNKKVVSRNITSNNSIKAIHYKDTYPWPLKWLSQTNLSFTESISAGLSSAELKEMLEGPILYNLNKYVRSITIPDMQMSIESLMGNLQKERYMSPTFFSGVSGGTFSTTFLENSELAITKVMNLWYKYIKLITTGQISPPAYVIANNIVDYKASCYMLSYDATLKNLQFYGKFSGIMPTKLPLSPFSAQLDSHEKVTIDQEWSYDLFEYLDSDILLELDNIIKAKGAL